MFRKKLSLFASFIILVSLFAYTGRTSASASEQARTSEEPAGAIGTMLFEELWPAPMTLPTDYWEITDGSWFTPGTPLIMRQDDDTPQQINIAFETSADIADGVIYGSMQLLTLPEDPQFPFPHGFLFRYRDINNFYGVGFLDEDTLALGRRVNGGVPEVLATVDGFDALALHQFKIVASSNAL